MTIQNIKTMRIVCENTEFNQSLEQGAQIQASTIQTIPNQKAKLEQPTQCAAHLKKILKETQNPASRFEMLTKEFESIPQEFQAKTRTLLM